MREHAEGINLGANDMVGQNQNPDADLSFRILAQRYMEGTQRYMESMGRASELNLENGVVSEILSEIVASERSRLVKRLLGTDLTTNVTTGAAHSDMNLGTTTANIDLLSDENSNGTSRNCATATDSGAFNSLVRIILRYADNLSNEVSNSSSTDSGPPAIKCRYLPLNLSADVLIDTKSQEFLQRYILSPVHQILAEVLSATGANQPQQVLSAPVRDFLNDKDCMRLKQSLVDAAQSLIDAANSSQARPHANTLNLQPSEILSQRVFCEISSLTRHIENVWLGAIKNGLSRIEAAAEILGRISLPRDTALARTQQVLTVQKWVSKHAREFLDSLDIDSELQYDGLKSLNNVDKLMEID